MPLLGGVQLKRQAMICFDPPEHSFIAPGDLPRLRKDKNKQAEQGDYEGWKIKLTPPEIQECRYA